MHHFEINGLFRVYRDKIAAHNAFIDDESSIYILEILPESSSCIIVIQTNDKVIFEYLYEKFINFLDNDITVSQMFPDTAVDIIVGPHQS